MFILVDFKVVDYSTYISWLGSQLRNTIFTSRSDNC